MKVTFEKNNLSGNQATIHTLRKMRVLVNKYKKHPAFFQISPKIFFEIDGRDFERLFKKIYDFVLNTIRYQKDVFNIEVIKSPIRTLEQRFGDCDDMSILIMALGEFLGYQSRGVLVSNRKDRKFHHVFAQLRGSEIWYTLDPVEKVFTNKKIPLPGITAIMWE